MDTTLVLPADLRDVVDAAIARAIGEHWATRLWDRDTSLWSQDHDVQDRIWDRLGWLASPSSFTAEAAELAAFGLALESEGYTDALVMGMGGSSLAPEVLSLVFPESDKGLRLHVLDSTHPEAVATVDAALDAEHTVRVVATKSGTTTETLALLAHFWEREEHRLGRFSHHRAGDGFVSISDPGAPLQSIPHTDRFREAFLNPPDVGGRYSALTYVGLVPAAMLRLDLDALLEDALLMAELTRYDREENPALVLGAAMAALANAGRDKLTFVIEPDLAPLGAWLEQLIAESTGKQGVGIVPVDGEPLGEPSVYGPDRVFVRLGPASDSEWHQEVDLQLAALTAAGHPLIDIRLDDASWVSAEFFRWEFATAVAGIGLGVNPFDEPNVTESKQNTAAVLQVFAHEGQLPQVEPAAVHGSLRAYTQPAADGQPRDRGDLVAALRAHLARVPDDGYFQVGAFIAPTPARSEILRRLQARLRDATHKASTLGYGPRFLHSTGQLHKGGRPTGCFIQLTGGSGGSADLPIPGRRESFGVLVEAQALGDFEAFGAHGLPAMRIDLGADVDAGLAELESVMVEALT
jgi:transaldolase / glucose-6-phosphate isomerase